MQIIAESRGANSPGLDLDALGVRIEGHFFWFQRHNAITHGRLAGELLLEIKAALPHGTFLKWIADHTSLPRAMAEKFMKLARDWDVIEYERTLRLGGRRALREMTKPRQGKSRKAVVFSNVVQGNFAREPSANDTTLPTTTTASISTG